VMHGSRVQCGYAHIRVEETIMKHCRRNGARKVLEVLGGKKNDQGRIDPL
jgi:hypothetical protein